MSNSPRKEFYSIEPLGDSAILLDFGNVIEENINRKVLATTHNIATAAVPGITDVVPAYSSVTIHYNVVLVRKHFGDRCAFSAMKTVVENAIANDPHEENTRRIKVPVCYHEKYGWDLAEIAAHAKLTIPLVIQLHLTRKYRVYMVGFIPGFAYLGEVDESIRISRKAEPRSNIAAGSVGIAGKQTGIYPLISPGGWQIVGRTPLKIFDKTSDNPVLFKAGDEIEFYSIAEDEFDRY